MEDNVIVAIFVQESRAYQAFSVLRDAANERVRLYGAYVVERDARGNYNVHEQNSELAALPGTTTGGMIGTLVGILGEPFGVLLGGATGLLIGSSADAGRADREESILGQIAQLIPAGATALVAAVGESAEEIIDADMARLDAILVRYPVSEVEAEIAAQDEAFRAAEREARRILREQNVQERRAQRDAWWADFSPKARRFLIGEPDPR